MSRGDFGWGDFGRGDFGQGDFVRGDFVLEPWEPILSALGGWATELGAQIMISYGQAIVTQNCIRKTAMDN